MVYSTMQITPKLITKNFKTGRAKRIEFPRPGVYKIVIHTYNGKGTSLYNWFQENTVSTSAHYSVWKNGTIEQYVRENDTAWHAGQSWWNDVSIGIEHQDDGNPADPVRTEQLYEASAELVADICRRWNIALTADNIVPHKKTASTGCPGGLDVNRIITRAQHIAEAAVPIPQPEPMPIPIPVPEPTPTPEPTPIPRPIPQPLPQPILVPSTPDPIPPVRPGFNIFKTIWDFLRKIFNRK